jgi:hypothetical protein
MCMRLPKRQRVSVTLDTGRTIDGVLVDRRGEFLALRSAQVEVDGKPAPADGVVMVPRARIEFVQVLA